MSEKRVAYCGGILECNGYKEPASGNVKNIIDNWPNGKNNTDADAYIFEGDRNPDDTYSNKKLHIFKSNCSPIMTCTYNSSGGYGGESSNTIKIIHNQENIWKKIINPLDENRTVVMGNKCNATGGTGYFYKFRIGSYEDQQEHLESEPKYTEFFDYPNTVKFFFVNDNDTNDIPSATTEGMFYKCENLETCDVPCQMRKISNETFLECTHLTSYTRNPDFVEEIGEKAFKNCESMNPIVIGKFASISSETFANCSAAETIEWHNVAPTENKCNMTEIPEAAFSGCSSLRQTQFSGDSYPRSEVVIPKGITKICENAFRNCSNMSSLVLNEVTRIEKYAFYNCSNLISISGFENVTYIGEDAFKNSASDPGTSSFDGLTAATNIGDNAFYGVSFNANINLQNCESIGSSAFCYADFGTNDITLYGKISNNSVNMGEYAFGLCSANTVNITNTFDFNGGDYCFDGASIQTIHLDGSISSLENVNAVGFFFDLDTTNHIPKVYIDYGGSGVVLGLKKVFSVNNTLKFYVNNPGEYRTQYYDAPNWQFI